MAEQNNDLAALAGQAAGLDDAAAAGVGQGVGEGAGQQAEAAPGQSNAEILAGTFQMLREAGCILGGVESPRRVLDDGTLSSLGSAWGAVCDKRGWNLAQFMGNYGPEVAAVMMTVTVVNRVHAAVRAELAAREPVEAEVVQPAEAPAEA